MMMDECLEATEEDEVETIEEEASESSPPNRLITNPLEIRPMGESPDLRNFSPDCDEDSPLQSLDFMKEETLPSGFLAGTPPPSSRERRRSKDKERANRVTGSRITKALEDFFHLDHVDGVLASPDIAPSARTAEAPILRGRRGSRGSGRGSRPPSGDAGGATAESRDAARRRKKAAVKNRSFDRDAKLRDQSQSASFDSDPLMMSYPTMRAADMRTASNSIRSSQLDISVDSTEHYQSLALQPVHRIGASVLNGSADGNVAAEASVCSTSLNLSSLRSPLGRHVRPTRHNSFQSAPARRPRIPSEVARCPQDRIEFCRKLSATLSSWGKKNRERERNEERDLARQVSSEEQVYQARLHDLVWLELLAWRYGLSMKSMDATLMFARESFVPEVLVEVLDFEFRAESLVEEFPCQRLPTDCGSPCPDFSSPDHGNLTLNHADHTTDHTYHTPSCPTPRTPSPDGDFAPTTPTRSSFSTAPCSLYHDFDAESSHAVFSLHWAPSRCHVASQRDAMIKVGALLDRVQAAEALFPTTKAFGYFFEEYRTEKFVQHVEALSLWLNLTTDLILKVQTMAKFLHLTQMSGLNLPWLDFEFPAPPEVGVDFLAQNRISESLTRLNLVGVDDEDEEDGPSAEGVDPSISDSGYSPFFAMEMEAAEEEQSNPNSESKPGISLTIPSDDDNDDVESDDENRCISVVNPLGPIVPKVRFRSVSSEIGVGSPSLSSSASPSTSSPRDIPLSPPLVPPLAPLAPRSPERVHGVSVLQSPPNVSTKDLKSPVYASKTIIYRKFVDKSLKQMGLRKLMAKVLNVLQGTMEKIRVALEHPSEAESLMVPDQMFGAKSLSAEALEAYLGQLRQANSMSRCVDALEKMQLPSLRPAALFLARVPLDVVHECLRLRLDQRPRTEPSVLSIRQLMAEYKEVLRTAMTLRQYYEAFVSLIRGEESVRCDGADPGLETFNDDVQEMLRTYFWSLEKWLHLVQKAQDFPVDIRSLLEDEWLFIQSISTQIPSGFVQAAAKFWDITAGVFDAISLHLTKALHPCLEEDAISSRQNYVDACRRARNVFKEVRERAFKICAFARDLKTHTHCAFPFQLTANAKMLVELLDNLGFVQIVGPKTPGCLLLVPKSLSQKHEGVVGDLLEFVWSDEGLNKTSVENRDSLQSIGGYLLVVRCHEEWKGLTYKVESRLFSRPIPLNSFFDAPLLFVSPTDKNFYMQRDFQTLVGPIIEPFDDEIPLGTSSLESVRGAKRVVIRLMGYMSKSISSLTCHLSADKARDAAELTPGNKHFRDTIAQCYKLCFEYHKEATKLVSLNSSFKTQLSQNLIALAKQWMCHVLEAHERGRGSRPRWAAQGLDFIAVAIEPRVLARVSQTEYESIQNLVNRCLSHIAGDQTGLPRKEQVNKQPSPNSPFLGQLSWPESLSSSGYNSPTVPASPVLPTRSRSIASTSSFSASKARLSSSSLSYSDAEDSPGCGGCGDDAAAHPLTRLHSTPTTPETPTPRLLPKDRIRRVVSKLEEKRNEKRFEKGQIGRVTQKKMDPVIQYTGRKVNFRWQRGNKIGEGQYGKVYACVNIDTGELMAMKCIRLNQLDHKTIKSVADEIKIIEGFAHTNLVRYFGVELHSDELLLFMEYCGEGTLEDASRGGQLPELMIRRYSRDVLQGISYLHENGIAHRDIKGANIFLTRGGRIKLGDFGCSAKLESHTTQPGEFNSMVGTVAFMAPEIITKTRESGHGRLADVWSFGCVVIQMWSGNRPWFDLENNYQIMFKVGMGARPTFPENASTELEDFLDRCLQHDAKDRWTADQLLDHSFTKVYTEPD